MKPETTVTIRSRLPLWICAGLLIVSILIPHPVWLGLLIVYAGLLLVAYAWARTLAHSLTGERKLRFHWVAVGDQLEEWLEVRNQSWVPALWAELVDESNVPGYRASGVISVGSEGGLRWRQQARCQRRGRFTLGPWSIRTGDPFGFFDAQLRFPISQEIVIHPPIHTQLPVPLPAGPGSGRVRRQRRVWQSNINAAGVRGYRPNDPYHHIHWRSTAKRGELVVREYDQDTGGDVWLLLDMQRDIQLGDGADSTEEHAVLLAASLANLALQRNRAIGLAAYAETPQIVPPARGQGQRWRLLEALALISADSPTPLKTALADLNRIAQRGSAVLIVTATPDNDWLPALLPLAQRGIAIDIVLLDRPSFDTAEAPSTLRDTVRRLGFQCQMLTAGTLGERTVTPQTNNQIEFRTTPLGGVVANAVPSEVSG